MISKITSMLPFIMVPAVFFISAYVGISFLFASRDVVIDRYQDMIYRFANRTPDNSEARSYGQVVMTSRIIGLVALMVCIGSGAFAVTNMILK